MAVTRRNQKSQGNDHRPTSAAGAAERSAPDPRQLGALAVMQAQQGRPTQAADLLRQAIQCDPGIAELHNNLGMTLYSMQRGEEAIAAYRQALRLKPGYALAHNNLGVALASLDRHGEAIAAYLEALAIAPAYAEALSNLGSSLHAVGRSVEAEHRFRGALAIKSDLLDARVNLGHALSALHRPLEAIPCYEAEVKARPLEAAGYLNLATALREAGHSPRAIGIYQKAIELAPDLAAAHAGLGLALLENGRIEQAQHCYRQGARLEPRRPSHLLSLARCVRLTPDHPDLAAILDLARILNELPDDDQVNAHFALAKLLADIGRHAESFAHQLAGNRLKRRRIGYDEARTLAQLNQIQQLFTAEFLAARRQLGFASAQPIFIVGMPRSGSTLVEQILASHRDVFGAGEVDAFTDALRKVGLHSEPRPFPDRCPELTADLLSQAATQYLALLNKSGAIADRPTPPPRITDKMLPNFRYLGLIQLMLPNARIIHTTRDPIDSCLSCFSLQFAALRYTCDLGELGRYYAAYARLMAHWRKVLPQGRLLDVPYETLVDDVEATARRIIAHCGLPWDEACLRFYDTERPVRTSSLTQVRQPIYRDSVGRWRPEAEVLRPLLDALRGEADGAGAQSRGAGA